MNTDLTNYGQKKSIINIQDLGLSAASQHSVGGQLILRGVLEVFYFKKVFLERKISNFRKFFQDNGRQPIP
jgi:hypothetical protein